MVPCFGSLIIDFFLLVAIADETTKAVAKLIARQRSVRARKRAAAKAGAASSSKNPQSSPRRGRAPILPATVKAELQDLLSSSPLLLLDFDKAFFRRFGRAFQYTQYGFFSIFEVLRSVSDIIAVEQTRAGSLLTLKKHLASEIEREEMPQGEAWEEMPQGEAVCYLTETISSHKRCGQATVFQVNVTAFPVVVVAPVPLGFSIEGLWGAAEAAVTMELSW